ncbi:MAG: hypothetical protein M1834_003249 [Cirrosporium novae-zelandiae]|nr:MAG: hypothetical protein M1834_003249 [Cirrosporium novae-zelandiae]
MASIFKSDTTYDPIYLLLNAHDEQDRDHLTNRWKENKLAELNFVGIVGALLAGVLTSTGSWPNILPDGSPTPWTVRSCWYCGIILALLSVVTAAQQSIRLHRLSGHRDAEEKIRSLLSKKYTGADGQILPRIAQIYAWQLAVLFLTASVLAMFVGMFILIWSSTGRSPPGEPWWDQEAKMAVSFTVVATFTFGLFLAQQVTMFQT